MKHQFIAFTVDNSEADSNNRPNAAILRVAETLQRRVLRAVELIKAEGFSKIAIPLGRDGMRWIGTVGYLPDGSLAPVLGVPGQSSDWMPADADVRPIDQDVYELDLDGEIANYREDCIEFGSANCPMVGDTVLEIFRWNTGTSDHEGTTAADPLHFYITGENKTGEVSTLVYRLWEVWPDLVGDEQPPAQAETEAEAVA